MYRAAAGGKHNYFHTAEAAAGLNLPQAFKAIFQGHIDIEK